MKPAPYLLRERLAPFAATLPERPQREERRAVLAEAACAVMAEFGAQTIPLGTLARELGMCRATAARIFPTTAHILAEILTDHLTRLADAILLIPEETPRRDSLVRAMYLRATRTEGNDLSAAHHLLVRERDRLPPDLLAPIEELRDEIAASVAPRGPRAIVFALLDTPFTDPAQIEALLTGQPLAAEPPAAEPPAAKPDAAQPPTPTIRPPHHLALAAANPLPPAIPAPACLPPAPYPLAAPRLVAS